LATKDKHCKIDKQICDSNTKEKATTNEKKVKKKTIHETVNSSAKKNQAKF